ncbi:MAG: single-stranded DNA-binding protein [Clostridia bacterium]
MLNKIILIGRLTRDPELRYTSSGLAVANFTVAVDRPYKNQQGEKETDFIRVVVWRKQAENVANYLSKGRLVAVEGSLQIRNYEGQDGGKKQSTEVLADSVQFLESKTKPVTAENPGVSNYDDFQAPPEYTEDLPF